MFCVLLKRGSLYVNNTSQELNRKVTEVNKSALHLSEPKSVKNHFEIFEILSLTNRIAYATEVNRIAVLNYC